MVDCPTTAHSIARDVGEPVQAIRVESGNNASLSQRDDPNPCTAGVDCYRRYNHYNRDIIPRSNLVGHSTVEKMQVNCWVSGEAGERMKALAKMQNVSYGQLLTALLLEQPVAVQDWQTAVSELIQRVNEIEASLSVLQSLQGGDELRGLIADQDERLNALEVAVMTPITEGGGKVRVTLQPAEIEAVETNDNASSHPADYLPTAQEAKAQYERQLDEKIIALRKEGKIIKAIQKELKIGQKRVCKAIKDAGLKE